ncbi:MAG: maleylpyruvate isomerase N-terminal domain-containing protein [Dehalococcoidia bacterium]
MTERTFAGWVEPVATLLAEDRRQVLAFAQTAPAGLWQQPSEVPGWTHQDIHAHLAGGNDLMLQHLMRSVTAREPLDPAVLQLDTDAENARGVAERRGWSLDMLIAELQRGGDEVQDLLSHLTEDDRDLCPSGFSVSLGDFLRIVEEERHDLLHLEQLQAGLHAGNQ